MLVNTVPKQPIETFVVGLDFVKLLAPGESITGQAVTATLDGADTTSDILSGPAILAGSAVGIRLKAGGGVVGQKYLVHFDYDTSLGNHRRRDLGVEVVS